MGLKNAVNYVVGMVTYVAVGFLSYLQFMFLPVLMKGTTLCYFYRLEKYYLYSYYWGYLFRV